MSDKDILNQNLSEEEMAQLSAGSGVIIDRLDKERSNCVYLQVRNINRGGFPNCAATVEDNSWCLNNDACLMQAVGYEGMEKCSLAWH